MTTELLRLAELCEQAVFPCVTEADAEVLVAIKSGICRLVLGREYDAYSPDYTASLDAAMTLVPEWPNHGGYRLTRDDEFTPPYRAEIWEHPDAEPGDGWHRGRASTLALALCAASLRARSQESNHG